MMMNRRNFKPIDGIDADNVQFSLGFDRSNRTTVSMSINGTEEVSLVTPPALTMWPRVTGDGNYGTMFGPTDITKAKYSLDLTDCPFNGKENNGFADLTRKLNEIDDKLLEFVFQNQLKILSRKNLSKDEIKMLQIRSVRPKYDKNSGNLIGYNVNLSTAKYAWDGMGGKYSRKINITDHRGKVVEGANVCPGDVVSATIFANQVYTGVGGDKFGIHWSFEDVSVIVQRAKLETKSEVTAFTMQSYDYAQDYVVSETPDLSEQFGEE